MSYVRLELKGGASLNRKLNAIRDKLPLNIRMEATDVMYKKLKNVYAYKRDTGAIFRSIKKNKKKGIITMGGTDATKRTDFKGKTLDYTPFVELYGSRSHTFFLPKGVQSNKLSGGRKYRVETHAPVRGRRKAVARAIKLFPQLAGRAMRKTLK